MLRGVSDFRYAQYCPLARAAELLGERWTLLVVRELLMGPQRFTDLRERLPGVSPSVLSERLARLEERGVVRRRTLPPPTPATVYELSEAGRALEGAIGALAAWGMRFLSRPEPGDDVAPRAVRIVLSMAARRDAAPGPRIEVRMSDGSRELQRFVVEGGPPGARVRAPGGTVDVVLVAGAREVAALACGDLDPERAALDGTITVEGDVGLLAAFPRYFDLLPQPPTSPSGPAEPEGRLQRQP